MSDAITAPSRIITDHIKLAAELAGDRLWALHGITTAIHTKPAGSPVDPCTWCDLTVPEPAVVQFAHTDTADACLDCAATAGERAVENAGPGNIRIHADIYAVERPSITSEPDPIPAPRTVFESAYSDGYRAVLARGESTTTNPRWEVARQTSLFSGVDELLIKVDCAFDPDEPADRASMRQIADALLDVLSGVR